MKRQTRQFTVEVKQRRHHQKKGSGSIWANVDLSAAVVETARHFQDMEQYNNGVIDSGLAAADAHSLHEPRVEPQMANPLEADSAEVAAEPVMKSATTETKNRAPKARKVKTERRQSARPNDAATTAAKAEEIIAPTMRTGRKIYSEKERAHKLGQIEKSIGRGGTLKAAVKEVGITEQTYYHWKKAAAGPAEGDDLKDIVALEEENKRLKGLLAAQLRKENAELKKRLGL